MTTCKVCHERISPKGLSSWVHDHSGDLECWTGDGATAEPVDLPPRKPTAPPADDPHYPYEPDGPPDTDLDPPPNWEP